MNSTKIGIGHIARFSKKRWRIWGDVEVMSGTHWPCDSLSCSFPRTHLCIFFKKLFFFYAIRNSDFSIISYEVSKAILALYFGR